MAPLEMNNDEAFLNLLSSQRQLLSQLNMENALKREQQANAFYAQSNKGTVLPGGGLDPMSLMNRPIIERRGSMDYLLASQRLSIGMGPEPGAGMMQNYFSEFDQPVQKPSWDSMSVTSKTMKRRRSSLGLLGPMVFEDQYQSRRNSLLSIFSKSDDGDDDKLAGEDEFSAGFTIEKPQSSRKKVKVGSSVDTSDLRARLEAFSSAMEKSAKSQQDIHDWDRKMGLKRSHSKTMRMSMRSRKKLRNITKKEINGLLHAR